MQVWSRACVKPYRLKKGRRESKVARTWNCLVTVQGHELMSSDVANISDFERQVRLKLMLNSEVPEIDFGDPI